MANKTVEQLRADLLKATKKTKAAYEVIYGGADKESLKIALDIAKRDKDQAKIDKLNAEINRAQIAYKAAQDEKNAINKALKTAEKEATKIKEEKAKIKSAQSSYDKAMATLKEAEAAYTYYKGEEKYINAYKALTAAADMLKTAGGKPATLPKPKTVIPPAGQGAGSGTGATGATGPEPSISKILEGLADPKQKETLVKVQKALAKNFGYKGPTDGKWSFDFQAALQNAAEKRSQLPKTLQGTDLLKFVIAPTVQTTGTGTGSGSGAGGGPTTVKSVTKLTDAEIEEMVNKSALNLLGREINAEDKTANWYKSLAKTVKTMAQEGTVTKYSGGGTGMQSNVTTPGYTLEKAAQTIEAGLKQAAPVDLARKERVDFTSWMFQQLGGSNG
jgi:hypothetical protein